jgi:hypothetical protein
VFKRWTMLLAILAVTALFVIVGTTIAAQKAPTPKAQDNVAGGELEVKKMLPRWMRTRMARSPSRIS